MAHDSQNLMPMRGPNVWTQPRWAGQHTTQNAQRWMAGAVALALLALGLRWRSRASVPLTAAGAGLLALAATPGGIVQARAWIRQRRLQSQWRDPVSDASDLSFPASDSPSWTPTSSSGASESRGAQG